MNYQSSIAPVAERLKGKFLLSNTFRILKNPVTFLGELPRCYGPVVHFTLGVKSYFVLQHPDYIKNVLLDNHKAYSKPGATKILRLFLGEGLSTSNGELWLRQRRIMQPAFHKQRIALVLRIINEEITKLTDRLQSFATGSTINLSHEFLQLTIAIISRAMFSTALKKEMDSMIHALETLANYASKWMKSPVKIPANWRIPSNNDFRKNCKIFDDIIYSMIEKRKIYRSDLLLSPHDDLLDMLLDYTGENIEDGMTEKQLRDEVTTMFMAGHETTAQTLSWIFYHLAKDKSIYTKVKEESNNILNNRLPELDDLPHLAYTKQVVQEGLRLYPPIWALVRKPYHDENINGIEIPRSSYALINIYGIHHHPRFWEHPDDFEPNHFTVEKEQSRHPFTFLPFGGGPRLCLGSNFAMMVMQVTVCRLIKQFEFAIAEDYQPEIEINITLRAKNGIQLIKK